MRQVEAHFFNLSTWYYLLNGSLPSTELPVNLWKVCALFSTVPSLLSLWDSDDKCTKSFAMAPQSLRFCLFGILSVTHARQFLLFYLLVHRFFPLFLPFSVESITELLFWLQSKIFSPFYLLVTEWDNVFGLFAEAIFHLLLACLWLFAEVFSPRLI